MGKDFFKETLDEEEDWCAFRNIRRKADWSLGQQREEKSQKSGVAGRSGVPARVKKAKSSGLSGLRHNRAFG